MPKSTLPALVATVALVLAACGQTATSGRAADLAAVTGQATASTTTLSAGQTRQFTVTVAGQPAQPGQLTWSSTNAGVASVTQGGLVTAKAAGSATVRAALTGSPASFIDFPIVVQAVAGATPATPSGTFAQRVLDLTNAARTQARTCGSTTYAATTPVTYNAALEKAAQAHAADMAAKNYFSHTSQDGRTFSQRVTAAGYSWTRVAENIAAGQPTPEAVVAGWLQSAGHCANIMNPALKELGVGYAAGGSYGHYWVQDFGTR
ncbi:uncharacterized protein YkwD [Deinococcus metalli]|nr:CAP domain-containing protein [Deinococcus metalli]MBB5377537.1 uncharacterized protein YkwD [Deinococcus metalli]